MSCSRARSGNESPRAVCHRNAIKRTNDISDSCRMKCVCVCVCVSARETNEEEKERARVRSQDSWAAFHARNCLPAAGARFPASPALRHVGGPPC